MALSYKTDPKTNSDDDELNPYNRRSSYDPESLSGAEQAVFDDIVGNYDDEADSSQEDDNVEYAKQISDRESAPRTGWQNNVSAVNNSAKGQAGKGKVANLVGKTAKKGGPAGIIIALVLGAAGLVSFFGGPGLLIVHVVETITSRFDPMSAILDERSGAIITAKLKNTTTGLCGEKFTMRCKYAHMSNLQVERFNRNTSDIRIIVDDSGSRIPGYNRISSVEYKGNPLTASQFNRLWRTEPEFKVAMMDAYNWRFLSKSYKPFMRFAGAFGFSKKPQFSPDDSDADRNAKMKNVVAYGSRDIIVAADEVDPDTCGDDADCRSKLEEEKERQDKAKQINDEAKKNAEEQRKAAQPGTFKRIVSGVGVFGAFSEPCAIPFAINAIGVGVKLNRAEQLMRYASMFLVAHSMIKAGDADHGTMSFLGNKITETFVDEDGNVSKPGTDGIGYRKAAYNDRGLTDLANQAVLGGHIGGTFAQVARVSSTKEVQGVCKVLNNPLVIAGGLAATIIPGVKLGTTGAAQAFRLALGQALTIGGRAFTISMVTNYLVMLMVDILSGNAIDENTVGEEAVDKLVVGAWEGTLRAGGFGGGLVLNPSQAAKLENTTVSSYTTDYQNYARVKASPLDVSNKYTVLGAAYSSMLPHMVSSSKSVAGAIASVQRIAGSIPTFLSPRPAKAVSTEDYTACLDYVYREYDFATTEFCNVIRGIPAEYLNLDPNVPLDYLIDKGYVDEETGQPKPGTYSDFIDDCFMGAIPEDSKCMADSREKIYFALYYIDSNVEDVFENGLPEPEAINQVGSRTPPAGEPGRFDDTSLSCPEGTTDDLGVITTRYAGPLTDSKYPKIRVCRIHGIPGFGVVPGGEIREVNTGAVVNAAVAPIFVQLVEDYNNLPESEKSKISLRANSSFRLQDSCEIATPGAQCADPGLSNHQLGTGIDFALSDGKALSYPLPSCVGRITSVDPAWKFLNTYGPKHGIKQLSHENWHWEAGTKGEHLCPA